ncbi:hypothetical protein V7Z47_26960, partial [Priestia megaterium]|uniref:hypothetical protein n=1 Tax=Priestia megaterium TaxID=1404 RepID=UPI002FFFE487
LVVLVLVIRATNKKLCIKTEKTSRSKIVRLVFSFHTRNVFDDLKQLVFGAQFSRTGKTH